MTAYVSKIFIIFQFIVNFCFITKNDYFRWRIDLFQIAAQEYSFLVVTNNKWRYELFVFSVVVQIKVSETIDWVWLQLTLNFLEFDIIKMFIDNVYGVCHSFFSFVSFLKFFQNLTHADRSWFNILTKSHNFHLKTVLISMQIFLYIFYLPFCCQYCYTEKESCFFKHFI